ncbi:class I adenylate-forming enzyme family protein [Novosphingobium soli]|uniref:Acyl-protein synthetase LuxE domain-containing protein n=1 Tax=Novosphingobium soli TaxID=574956 RepID=A0ABV6D155_9SPHN
MATTAPPRDTALEREAQAWMDDPYGHFGHHNTRIHSLERAHVEAVQLAAMNQRLEERRSQIQVLAKLADAQGIDRLDTIDAMAPLLMPHDIYKSYPVSLLAKGRFGQLNTWLSRLTRHDPGSVDVSACDSIDSWLVKLREETPLDVATSSGSTGTCSFFPKSKADYGVSVMGLRVQLAQAFGADPRPGDIDDAIHAVVPLYRDGHASTGAFPKYIREAFCKGDDAKLHTAFDFKISSDLMWLAARLRAAAAQGDGSRVEAPPALLARRAEWETSQAEAPARQMAFIQRMVTQLAGERVFAMGTSNMFYAVAQKGLEQGIRASFAPDSVLMGGGGAKGVPLPEDLEEVICGFFGFERMTSGYGMTEMNSFSILCEHDRYHVLPWVTVYQLDLDSGRPLPRAGVQTGRAAFFDMTQDSTWGGLVTGDLVTVDWDTPCGCGRSSVALDKKIARVSELQGGDDKISCAATPQAQAEAIDFLTGL